jgi:hypothetical protein
MEAAHSSVTCRHIPEDGLLDESMDMNGETGVIHNTP